MITAIDAAVLRLEKALKEADMLDDTLIVFTSDVSLHYDK